MRLRCAITVMVLNLAFCGSVLPQTQQATLHWQPWSNAVFVKARAEHKFVLLDLEAVWCHWCHVMDDVTYRDPEVIRLLKQRYLLIKVDQDSRPDISNRYQDYGWPATVVFAADGSEIVKRQGYLPPRLMASMLQAIIEDPSPGPSVQKEAAFQPAARSAMTPALLKQVQAQYEMQYDKQVGGWSFGHKYLDSQSIEYAMRLAAHGNGLYAKRAADTLHDATALLDPVWGGMYQYSIGGVWNEPHYEKLISIQAVALRDYSLAYAQTQKLEDLQAAQSVHQYVTNFLMSPTTGAFYVSQDADLHDRLAAQNDEAEDTAYFKLSDRERRAQGILRVDTHVYARENGWMIAALCDYYAASGDASALAQAQRAASWIVAHRGLPGGGFRHAAVDRAGPYLGDTLAAGQGFLALYIVTGNRQDLKAAEEAAQFIAAHFAPISPGTGFVTSQTATNATYRPHPDRDENIALVRFSSKLALASGNPRFHTMAEEAMRYIAARQVALTPLSAGTLLADEDVSQLPIHATIVGSPSSADAVALHTAVLRAISSHEVIEIRDPADLSPLPTSVTYPHFGRAALFLCTARACSSPAFHAQDVREKIQRAQLQSQP